MVPWGRSGRAIDGGVNVATGRSIKSERHRFIRTAMPAWPNSKRSQGEKPIINEDIYELV